MAWTPGISNRQSAVTAASIGQCDLGVALLPRQSLGVQMAQAGQIVDGSPHVWEAGPIQPEVLSCTLSQHISAADL